MNITAVDKNIVGPEDSKATDKEQQTKLLKLQKACRDFESIFIYYMLKTMRSASSKSNLFGEGLGSDMYQQMFDQGLADKMSTTGEFGISEAMYKKYAELIGGAKADEKAKPVDFKPVARKAIIVKEPQKVIPINHHQNSIEPPKPAAIHVPAPEKTKTITQKAKSSLSNYETIINEAAAAHKVDPQLVKAVMLQESGGNPKAVSAKGAKGLMQLMDGTAKMLGVSDPFNIKENINGGVKYLASLLQKFEGDMQKALAAYNAGPAAVEKYDGVPPYEETTKFVEAVMGNFGGLFNSDKSR